MSGLLDFLNSPEAQLGIGLLAYSGDMGRPMSLGERLAGGLGHVQQQQQQKLRAGLLEAQLAETQAQAQQRAAEIEAAQRKRAALSTGVAFTGQPGGQGGSPGMTVNPQALLAAGYSPDEITKLASLQNLGRQEVARTISTMDANNRPVTNQYDKFGVLVGESLPEWKAPLSVNQGDRTTFIDQTNLKPLGSFDINMSKGEQASNAVARANLGIAQQRLAMDRANEATKGQTYDADRGLLVNTRTGQASPVMQGGAAIGAKDKGLNEGQAKANLFGSRMAESEKVIQEMHAKGVTMPSIIKSAVERTPLIGGALGAAANSTVASDDQQRVEQAQRDFINAVLRRESGAAIAESEFANARKQYFPQIGDSPAVIEQKARNRALATQGMLAEVPEGKRSTPSAPTAGGGFKILGVR